MAGYLRIIAVLVIFISIVVKKSLYLLISPKTDFSSVQNTTISLLASSQSLNDPFMTNNPYEVPQTPETMNRTGFCAVKIVPGTLNYHIKTFDTQQEAQEAGWKVTHEHKCGACSTLRDLAVYLQHPDLTAPVRRCGALAYIAGEALFFECLENLGFTRDCAKIWYYNSRNTAKECLKICMLDWIMGDPSNQADGSLSPCLYCDETKSGPIFQRYAGRTRRNSGIISSIGRYQSEIFYVDHEYFSISPKI